LFVCQICWSVGVDHIGIDQQSNRGISKFLLLAVQSMKSEVFTMRGENRWKGLILISEFDGGILLV